MKIGTLRAAVTSTFLAGMVNMFYLEGTSRNVFHLYKY